MLVSTCIRAIYLSGGRAAMVPIGDLALCRWMKKRYGTQLSQLTSLPEGRAGMAPTCDRALDEEKVWYPVVATHIIT